MAVKPKKKAKKKTPPKDETTHTGKQSGSPEKPPIGAFEIKDPYTKGFNISPVLVKLPADQVKLSHAIYGANAVLKVIFKNSEEKYKEYLKALMEVAEVGLEGPKIVHPKLAMDALEQIKTHIFLREGRDLKKKYLAALLRRAAGLGGVGLIVTMGLDNNWPLIFDILPFGLVWAGAMTGVWISVALRRTTMSFEELPVFYERKIVPFLHLTFAGIITVFFALFLKLKIFGITFNDIDFTEFYKHLELALALGFLGGFSEKALSLKILKKAQEVFGGEKT